MVAFGSECLLVLLSRQSGRGTITSHRRKSFLKACERRRPTKLVGIWKTSDEKVRINEYVELLEIEQETNILNRSYSHSETIYLINVCVCVCVRI